jgi:hypothetical protein
MGSRRQVTVTASKPDQVRQERVVTRPALQQAIERLHQPADPSLGPWKPSRIGKHDASMTKSSRQVLLVQGEVVRGVLGHYGAALRRRPRQYFRIVQMSEVRRGSRGCHVVSTLVELLRNGAREMLVEEQPQPPATRRRRPAAASASSARSWLRWIQASISSA